MKNGRVHLLAIATLFLLPTTLQRSAVAQIMGDLPTIRKMSLGPAGSLPNRSIVATLIQAPGGDPYLKIEDFERPTGRKSGAKISVNLKQWMEEIIISFAPPVDVLVSTVFRPGSVLVLDEVGRVIEFPLAFDANGKPKLAGPPVLHNMFSTLMEEEGVRAVSLGEAPNAANSILPFMCVGVSSGIVGIYTDKYGIARISVSSKPITDVETVPQVGYFALVALTGGRIVGINPDTLPADAGLTPAVTFDLIDRRTVQDPSAPMLRSISNPVVFEPNSEALVAETAIPLAATDGEHVFGVEIPPGAGGENDFPTETIKMRAPTRLADVEMYRYTDGGAGIALLAENGQGIQFDPDFDLRKGPSKSLLTLSGASFWSSPETINLHGHGHDITGVFEIENDGVMDLKEFELKLGITDGTSNTLVVIALAGTPIVGDANKNGIADLEFRVLRSDVLHEIEEFSVDTALFHALLFTKDGLLIAAPSTLVHIRR